jgi:O-antigen/teichoic acid export membrane protein
MLAILKQKYINLTTDKKFSEILTGSVYSVVAQVAAIALTMIANIIIARVYGAGVLGILAMVNSFLMLVTIFTVMGTGTSILRLIPEHVAKHSVTSAFRIYRKTQYFVAGASLTTGAFFFFAAGFVATRIFSKPHLSFFFALAAIFVIFKSLMDLNTQAVRGLRLIRTFAIMKLIPSASMLAILVAVTLLFRSPAVPVYAQLAAFGVTAVIGVWIMDRAFKRRMQPAQVIRPVAIREILSISLPMLMTASMTFFIGQTGVIILGMFRSESEVGYYAMAVKLAGVTTFVLQAINAMAAPKFSELYHTGKMDELFHVARKSTKLIFWTTTPVLVGLLILGKICLRLLFGDDFSVAYPAMVLIVIGQFVNSVSGSNGHFMDMTGHQKVLRNIIFFAALINIMLGWVLIPRFGINGAAFAAMVSLIFWNVYVLIYIKGKYGRMIGYVPFLL